MPVPVQSSLQPFYQLLLAPPLSCKFQVGDTVALRSNLRTADMPHSGRGIVTELPGYNEAYPWCYEVTFTNGFADWFQAGVLTLKMKGTPYTGVHARHFDMNDVVRFDAAQHRSLTATDRQKYILLEGIIYGVPMPGPLPQLYMVRFKGDTKLRVVNATQLRLLRKGVPAITKKGSPSG